MIKRIEGVSILQQREYITAENKAYDELVRKGYTPQGMDQKFKNVVIVKIENENTNKEKREWFYFENWQTANENLR